MSIKLIIYDLDGTIIDSAPIVVSIVNVMRRGMGKNPINEASLMPWISLGGSHLIANALEIDQHEAMLSLQEFRMRYLEYCPQESDLYPGIRYTLENLAMAGKKLAICSNKPRKLVDKILTELSLDQYFECIVAGDDLSTQKPNPKNLLECLRFFKCLPSAAILVGDSTIDQKMAIACQTPFVFFQSGYNDGVNISKVHSILEDHEDLLALVSANP